MRRHTREEIWRSVEDKQTAFRELDESFYCLKQGLENVEKRLKDLEVKCGPSHFNKQVVASCSYGRETSANTVPKELFTSEDPQRFSHSKLSSDETPNFKKMVFQVDLPDKKNPAVEKPAVVRKDEFLPGSAAPIKYSNFKWNKERETNIMEMERKIRDSMNRISVLKKEVNRKEIEAEKLLKMKLKNLHQHELTLEKKLQKYNNVINQAKQYVEGHTGANKCMDAPSRRTRY